MHPWVMKQVAEDRARELRRAASAHAGAPIADSNAEDLGTLRMDGGRPSSLSRLAGELLIRAGRRLAGPETLPQKA